MIDAKAIIRRYAPRAGFLALLCVGAVLTLKLGEVALGVALGSGGPTYEDGKADQRAAALRSVQHETIRQRDSVKADAFQARKIYVVRARDFRSEIAALPPATIVGDTLTLPDGPHIVEPVVMAYIGGLRKVLATTDSALAAADLALQKTVQAAELSEQVAAQSDTLATIAVEKAEGHKPGLLSRAWSQIRGPVTFVGGAITGILIAKAIP